MNVLNAAILALVLVVGGHALPSELIKGIPRRQLGTYQSYVLSISVNIRCNLKTVAT
jgi:hypothetical protein